MTPCPSCARHLRSSDSTCPFCNATTIGPARRALNAVGGAVTALVLAACYGPPSDAKFDDTGDSSALTDADGDTYTSDVDCNDADATINPGATEICDDTVDNDCDDLIDTADDACA